MRTYRHLAAGLALALGAACEGTTAPAGDIGDIEAALDVLAAEANRAGDSDAAAGWSGGALAIRLGASPTEIVVSVGGESERYLAVVTATAHTLGPGQVVLRRSLVAWTSPGRPEAILQVTTFSDQGQFHWPQAAAPNDQPSRALGIWANLVRRHRWVATSGSAAITQASLGDPCFRQPPDVRLRCYLATFDVGIEGEFHPVSGGRATNPALAMAIATAAQGVGGVVIARVP